jgi:hypothetical protein
MAQARRSSSTSRSRTASFKQPPALKRLGTSLDTAQKALGELTRGGGRDVSKSSKDIYTDLRKFLSNARTHTNKLGKALQRDFEQAQKQLAKGASGSTSGRSSSSRSTSRRSSSSRSTGGRSTTRRAASSRSTSGRSTAKRASSSRSSTSRRSSSAGSSGS